MTHDGEEVTDMLDAVLTAGSYMFSLGPVAFLEAFGRIFGS